MPETSYVHAAVAVVDTVDDAIGTNHDLSDGRVVELRNDSAQLRKISEALGAADEKLAKPSRTLRRIPRDVTNNVTEVAMG